MTTVKNSYPEKQCVAFVSLPIEQNKVVDVLKLSTCSLAVRISAFVIMRNETGNFHSIINTTNPSGTQADSGRWASIWDKSIFATCIKNENMTGKARRFIVFNSLATGIAFLIDRIEHKGLFIGEQVDSNYYKGDVKTVEDLAMAYWDEWVIGEVNAKPSPNFTSDFISMYKQAALIFS